MQLFASSYFLNISVALCPTAATTNQAERSDHPYYQYKLSKVHSFLADHPIGQHPLIEHLFVVDIHHAGIERTVDGWWTVGMDRDIDPPIRSRIYNRPNFFKGEMVT